MNQKAQGHCKNFSQSQVIARGEKMRKIAGRIDQSLATTFKISAGSPKYKGLIQIQEVCLGGSPFPSHSWDSRWIHLLSHQRVDRKDGRKSIDFWDYGRRLCQCNTGREYDCVFYTEDTSWRKQGRLWFFRRIYVLLQQRGDIHIISSGKIHC